jgi:hypothetical protein
MRLRFNTFRVFYFLFLLALPLVTGCHSDMQFLVGEDPRDHEEYLRKRFEDAGDFFERVEKISTSTWIQEGEIRCVNLYGGTAWFSFICPLMRPYKNYEFFKI